MLLRILILLAYYAYSYVAYAILYTCSRSRSVLCQQNLRVVRSKSTQQNEQIERLKEKVTELERHNSELQGQIEKCKKLENDFHQLGAAFRRCAKELNAEGTLFGIRINAFGYIYNLGKLGLPNPLSSAHEPERLTFDLSSDRVPIISSTYIYIYLYIELCLFYYTLPMSQHNQPSHNATFTMCTCTLLYSSSLCTLY